MVGRFTGRPLDADTALAWGLVNRVVPPGAAEADALALAAEIAANAPLAVRESKGLVYRSTHADDWGDEAWADNDATLARIFASEDAREGPRAFAEKRPPVWRGR